ncbi:YczE/YyaS/YitT family protein [Enterococcus cecorum]|uniref:YczE/YyaS/YitT family protein n=1 Tax=Enterococcus cecorum TaxID=44008 RepID=UPI00200B2B44|nr:YitT family protein [Enterococcus cecorum]
MKAVVKSSLILPAVFVCGLGVALFVRANLGTDPVTMLEIALAQITGLSLGQTALYFEGFIFLLFFFLNRKLIHVGSFLFSFGIGPAIDLSEKWLTYFLGTPQGLSWQIFYLISGTLLICWSLAFYIPLNYGYQTSDILTLSVSEWFHLSYGWSLTLVYGTLFILALLIGGPLGIGTVIATFSYGPIIEWMMKTFPFNAATLYQKLTKN